MYDIFSLITHPFDRLNGTHFSKYCSLCGYSGHKRKVGKLRPYCYLETPFTHLLLRIVSNWNFPVSPLGLIHVAQTIHIYSELQLKHCSLYTLECYLSEVKVVERGVELKLSCNAFSQPSRQLVWEAVTTLLSRNQTTRQRCKRKSTNAVEQTASSQLGDTGLSGDDD